MRSSGACHYRAGEFAAATKRLDQSLHGVAGWRYDKRRLFLAMAEYRLGHTAQARTYFKQAAEWIDGKVPNEPRPGDKPPDPLPWTLLLNLRLLRHEAESLLATNQPPTDAKREPKPAK